MTVTKIGKWGGLLLLGLLLLVIYGSFDPSESGYFPACPFYSVTGLECPGCGSQRAVHQLLNFEFLKAFKQNGLLVIAIPYVLFGFYLDRLAKPSEKIYTWKRKFYGKKAIYLVLGIICLFWIFRNL
ncbi:DUF2752 domain-containing protein [Salinimicrobium catena]|uniref:DUF2752 domain-containing protein n=1 Tax=Salinimicrobium catena TaxID=390640 RepID=UPI002FE480CD